MRKILVFILVFGVGVIVGWSGSWRINSGGLISPIGQVKETPTPLYEYSFDRLREKKFTPKKIELVEKMADGEGYQSWLFKFDTDEGAVSGQANIPSQFSIFPLVASQLWRAGNFPIIIMLRGYVEKEEYTTGVGTKNAAAYFAKNGFITMAPDFLGYGQSDPEPTDDLKSRFIRPATVLQLIASLEGLNREIATSQTPRNDIKIGLWGHSNGGQIALSVLESTGRVIPTTLWAPVSKPFPYSILYYTDDVDDHGKYLIKLIADFEKIYDAEKFSLINYFNLIKSPIQFHQGTADESVPKKWSDDLAKNLIKEGIKINYFVYSGADHNLKPGWDTAVKRDRDFFEKGL